MSKYTKKLVYFNKANEDLFERIQDKDFSAYVCDLIRADLEGVNNNVNNNDLEELKRKLDMINEKLEHGMITNVVTMPVPRIADEDDDDLGDMLIMQ